MLRFFLTSSPIFAVVALGYAAARLRLVAPQGFAAFAAYAFNLALPALLLGLLARQPLDRTFDPRFFAAMLAAGLLAFFATGAVALAGRAGLARAGAFAQAATSGNLLFLGIPLILAVLGERAAGPLALAILAEVGVLVPLGLAAMGLGQARPAGAGALAGTVLRATLLSPIVLSVLAGAALGLAGLALPGPLDRLAGFLGASAGPVALFALGGTLAGQRLEEGLGTVAAITLVKLAAYPAAAFALLRLAGVGPDAVAAGTLIASLPTAAYTFVFAQRFDAAPGRVSAVILVSTVAGAATFPAIAWLTLR